MHIIVLGGMHDINGIISEYTKERIEKCYNILKNNEKNVIVHFSGGMGITKILHSLVCLNCFNELDEKNIHIKTEVHSYNNNTVDEAIHFSEYFKTCTSNIKIITNDWHMDRVKYLFKTTFNYYQIKDYEFISVDSNNIYNDKIADEKRKIKQLIEYPYGKWKEWLNNSNLSNT